MKQMNIQKGNLLDAAVNGDVRIIMHGVNCFHGVNSGIAGEIDRRFPKVQEHMSQLDNGAIELLTRASTVYVTEERITKVGPKSQVWQDKPDTQTVPLDNPFRCINLFTQYKPGNDFLPSLFPVGISNINGAFSGETIGIPLIACGIGGGDWEYVMGVLLNYGKDVNWEVYVI